jgi:hypothetical protein
VIDLYDAEGSLIRPGDQPMMPFSTKQTCSKCHDYSTISSGWHFNAADQNTDPGRPGQPWILVDYLTATQLPLSHRQWEGTFNPEKVGLTPWYFIQEFGRHSPGGGVGENDSTDVPDVFVRWMISGKLEINCLSCHDAESSHDQAEYAGNTTSLIQTINNGTIFLQFMGHGGGHVWADYNLLNISDIHTFNNENFPFVSSFACYGSAFNYRQSSCIGEELTLLGDKGAIAHFGFTGYGYAEADENIAGYMNQALFDLKLGNIGYITDYAKARFYADNPYSSTNYALVQCGVLLGDHMANIISPDVIDNIEIADSHLEPGEILQASTAVDDDIFMGKYVIYDENDAQLSLNSYFPISTVAIDGVISTNVNTQYQIPSDSDASLNTIKLFAYGAEREIIGKADFTVGTANVQNISISPENPTAQDSVVIYADFITDEDIESILLITYILDEDDNSEIPIASYNMELIDGISYKTIDEIDYHNSSIVRYYFVINLQIL